MFLYICIRIYICIHIYVYVYIYTYIRIYIYICYTTSRSFGNLPKFTRSFVKEDSLLLELYLTSCHEKIKYFLAHVFAYMHRYTFRICTHLMLTRACLRVLRIHTRNCIYSRVHIQFLSNVHVRICTCVYV